MIKIKSQNGETIVYAEAITAGTTDLKSKNFNGLYNPSSQNIVIMPNNNTSAATFTTLPAGVYKIEFWQLTTGANCLGLILE